MFTLIPQFREITKIKRIQLSPHFSWFLIVNRELTSTFIIIRTLNQAHTLPFQSFCLIVLSRINILGYKNQVSHEFWRLWCGIASSPSNCALYPANVSNLSSIPTFAPLRERYGSKEVFKKALPTVSIGGERCYYFWSITKWLMKIQY